MLPLSIKPFLLWLVIGLAVGIGLTLAFKGCNENSNGTSIQVVSPRQIVKDAAKSENEYKEKFANLELQNQKLKDELSLVQTELSELKSRTKTRETVIKKMIASNGYPADKLAGLSKQGSARSDSSLLPCDSLAKEVIEYIADNNIKDSLYEVQAQKTDSIIAVKDSMILTTIKVHEEYKTLLDQSIKGQESLLKENKSLKKQIRRQKFRSTMKTIGFMVLSGAATFLLK